MFKKVFSFLLALSIIACLNYEVFAVNYEIVFNVKDSAYGAVGNGVTDDTSAIQSALNAANTNGGGVVYLPEGTYKTSSDLTVYSNTTVRGNKKSKISKANTSSSYTVLKTASGSSNIAIEKLIIENLKTDGNMGINIGTNTSNVIIQENSFMGTKSQAVCINATGIKHIQIINNHFEQVNYAVLTNTAATDLIDLRIHNNEFVNIYGDAIELNHPGNAYVSGSNISISGNYMSCPTGYGTGSTAGFGIGIAGATGVTITNNVIQNCRYEAIHIEDEAKHISIIGNIINGVQNDPDNGLNSGIYVIDGDLITISGNSIKGAHDYGIHLEVSVDNNATAVVISGNTVTDCDAGGITYTIYNGFSDSIISNNICISNGGNGISLGNNKNLIVTGNVCRDNAGYGLYWNKSGVNSYISNNTLIGNTLGEIGFSTSVSFPMILRDSSSYFTATPVSGYTPWQNAINLGKAAKGQLTVTASKSNNYSTELYDISWNGTTLTCTLVGSDAYGSVDVSTPQMNGQNLQVRTYSSTTDMVTFDVQFHGTILLK